MPKQAEDEPASVEERLERVEGRIMFLLWAAAVLFIALLANNYAQGLAGAVLGTRPAAYFLVQRDKPCPDGRPSLTFLAFTGRNPDDARKAHNLGVTQDVSGNAADPASWADTRFGLCVRK